MYKEVTSIDVIIFTSPNENVLHVVGEFHRNFAVITFVFKSCNC